MKILVINCGSSSLKYALIELPEYKVITSGNIEKVGVPTESFVKFKLKSGEKIQLDRPVVDHKEGIKLVLEILTNKEYGFVGSLQEIEAVGHRLVHGGEGFTQSAKITQQMIAKLEEYTPLAPLHNPKNLAGVYAAQEVLPNITHVGVFDTAFHQTMPKEAYLYALPLEFYTKFKVRRYGFHGTSHAYVSRKGAELAGLDYETSKIITAHIGSGGSMAAIKDGKSVDTSMGLTPLEGVVMGSRVGDLDPGITEFLLTQEFRAEDISDFIKDESRRGTATRLTLEDISHIYNKKSGLLGLAGVGSDDMRNVAAATEKNDTEEERRLAEQARTAMSVYSYRIRKYIGAYAAALGGVDLLVFTAGVGENRPELRAEACQGLEYMGIKLDKERNQALFGEAGVISAPDSRVKVLVVPTDEEYMIAKDTYEISLGKKL